MTGLSIPLIATGAGCLAVGSARRLDVALRPLGCGLVGAGLMLAATPALADQHRQAADNAEVACTVSSRELTRISLIGDGFASVSKITTGYPYNDFTVTHEPVRGDIYLSVPEGFAPATLSFFATSKKGFVYKFRCALGGVEAEQIFVTNLALAADNARAWEVRGTPRETAVRLIQAMAGSQTIEGFELRQPAVAPVRVGELAVRLLAEYRGSQLTGKVLRIENKGGKPAALDPKLFAPAGTLALSLARTELKAGEATTMWLVLGGGAW